MKYLSPHKDGRLLLTVYIQPRSSSNRIVGLHGDAVKIGITAPPVEGRANSAVIEFLAAFFHLPKSAVAIKSGAASRTKHVLLSGISLSEAARLLNAILANSQVLSHH